MFAIPLLQAGFVPLRALALYCSGSQSTFARGGCHG